MRQRLLFFPFILAGLVEPSIGQEQIFRVDVDAVNILVTAHDKKTGEFVQDLERNDFEIRENGQRQEITNFTRQTDLPLTIALCVDTSSSVKLKLEFEKEVATDFIYSVMQTRDKALLAEFDTGVTLVHDYTQNPNALADEIRKLQAGGGTSLYDAIYLISEQKMLNERGRKTLVILSDGADQTSEHTFEEALQMAYKAEGTIFAISTTRLGADIDHEGDNALKQLTEKTGGRAYYPYSTKQLTEAFREINLALRSQYSLAYVPINRVRDGRFRKVEVKIKRDGVIVGHRNGYYAFPKDALSMFQTTASQKSAISRY